MPVTRNSELDFYKKQVDACKAVLEKYLLNEKLIPICSENTRAGIDSLIARHLVNTGHHEWLIHDVTQGYQVGDISERALMQFCNEQKIFKGKAGTFVLEENYAIHSVRYFEARPVKKR